MATADLVILSSSPPRHPQFAQQAEMSSSPSLPSLGDILAQKPSLRTGSRAAPIPKNATATFTTAASLLKANPAVSSDERPIRALREFEFDDFRSSENEAVSGKSKEVAVKAARKPRAKKGETSAEGGTVKETRTARTLKTKPMMKAGGEPVRKPRAKKVDTEIQAKLPRGKVTKATPNVKGLEAPKAKAFEASSKYFAPTTAVSPDPFDSPLAESPPFEKAATRRKDLIPAKAEEDESDPFQTPTVPETGLQKLAGNSVEGSKKDKSFDDLFGNFGHNNSDVVPQKDIEAGVKKRKLSDLVKNTMGPPSIPASKPKVVKKKARTLTDQATSAYADNSEEPSELNSTNAPLLNYFSRNKAAAEKTAEKPAAKSKAKGKGKKAAQLSPILLSPESALKQVGNQDFLFGTSSQLVREQSPTLLRDLQKAMQESNQIDDPFADDMSDTSLADVLKESEPQNTKRNLWAASSRDSQGELLDIEVVDLVDSPISHQQAPSRSKAGLFSAPAQPALLPTPDASEEWQSIDELPPSYQTPKPESDTVPEMVAVSKKVSKQSISNATSRILQAPLSPAKRPASRSPSKSKSPAKKPVSDALDAMPDYGGYTTAQLAKEIASYHFKPVKSRPQMIALLEKCWEGKQRRALGSINTNEMASKATQEKEATQPPTRPEGTSSKPPPKPRGRPKKDTTATRSPAKVKDQPSRTEASAVRNAVESDSDLPLALTQTPKRKSLKQATLSLKQAPLDEISDSDTLLTPSPPRHSASQLASPLPLSAPIGAESKAEESQEESETQVFPYITRAIKSATRDTDSEPSWQEKILLYDPIVLEDLTIWLNTGALEKAGWDDEIAPTLVKKWCEQKSICCLWRENLKGGARARY